MPATEASGLVFFFVAILMFLPAHGVEAPTQIPIIAQEQANYLTPENSLAALHSCQSVRDMTWCDEVMTTSYREQQIQQFSERGMGRTKILDLYTNIISANLVRKVQFKDAVLFLVEYHSENGTI